MLQYTEERARFGAEHGWAAWEEAFPQQSHLQWNDWQVY